MALLRIVLLIFTDADKHDYVSLYFYLGQLVVSMMVACISYAYFYRRVNQIEHKWNKGKTMKLSKNHGWVPASVSDLRVGDIITVMNKSICPADILLFDTTETRMNEKIGLVNERKITGVNTVQTKTPISESLTSKHNEDLEQVLQENLTGTLEYAAPAEAALNLLGTFKLKGDPKSLKITSSNVVYTGSKIYTSK